MAKLVSLFGGCAVVALSLLVGCGDDTGTGASAQGGGSEGGGGESGLAGGGTEGGGVQGGNGGANGCADAGGGEAPAGSSPSEVACTDGCNRNAEITCELGCAETVDCVPDCVGYVDQTGPTEQCEAARLALFQCVAQAINAQNCSCTAAGGALSCEVCGPQKDALAFCK